MNDHVTVQPKNPSIWSWASVLCPAKNPGYIAKGERSEGGDGGRKREGGKQEKKKSRFKKYHKKVENKKCWGQGISKSIFKLKIQFLLSNNYLIVSKNNHKKINFTDVVSQFHYHHVEKIWNRAEMVPQMGGRGSTLIEEGDLLLLWEGRGGGWGRIYQCSEKQDLRIFQKNCWAWYLKSVSINLSSLKGNYVKRHSPAR